MQADRLTDRQAHRQKDWEGVTEWKSEQKAKWQIELQAIGKANKEDFTCLDSSHYNNPHPALGVGFEL